MVRALNPTTEVGHPSGLGRRCPAIDSRIWCMFLSSLSVRKRDLRAADGMGWVITLVRG
jgi:hypothetical protein